MQRSPLSELQGQKHIGGEKIPCTVLTARHNAKTVGNRSEDTHLSTIYETPWLQWGMWLDCCLVPKIMVQEEAGWCWFTKLCSPIDWSRLIWQKTTPAKFLDYMVRKAEQANAPSDAPSWSQMSRCHLNPSPWAGWHQAQSKNILSWVRCMLCYDLNNPRWHDSKQYAASQPVSDVMLSSGAGGGGGPAAPPRPPARGEDEH